ncbi:hypothetical protein K1T71_007612 [Dendrolimus kikuchii]|uniref:Uncharacterized protein n=1 Tax=Dendrolimus kikuchii TaxID=765133 RepID=A0ACC1CXQ5_9NEOP|nr:hypothetical protein K1T71_007612 [Dendrolimus kikuchii]
METLELLLILFLLATHSVSQSLNPVVLVSHGAVQGSWKVSTDGRPFASFEGIPYARPPVDEYRFREPQNMKPWIGVWNATTISSPCLQYEPFLQAIIGSENCLFLNVYTPNLSPLAHLTVMVFIHGGVFMYGDGGSYDPSNIMDWDIVLVTLNYRLGPLGFLSTGDEVSPGNFGLKDQSMALHWVKNNIRIFGGNPNSITLAGFSAGGASVHYHYLSPLSRGPKPLCDSLKLLTLYNVFNYFNDKRLLTSIAKTKLFIKDSLVDFYTPFVPTVEALNVRNPFLMQDPYQAALAGGMQQLPLITTTTTHEGLYPAAFYQSKPDILQYLEDNWDRLACSIFNYNDTLPVNRRPEVAAKIKQQYLEGKPVSQDTFPGLVQALGDRNFVVGAGKLAYIHALKSNQSTYLYKYAFRGNVSVSNILARNKENYGVSHGDDLIHIFKFHDLDTSSPQDKAMTNVLINMIYSFSTTGTPQLTDNGSAWTPVKPGADKLTYLEITSPTNFEMKSDADFGHKSFWDSLGFNENE